MREHPFRTRDTKTLIIACWATGGTLLLLVEAIVRLGFTVARVLSASRPSAVELIAGIAWTVIITYTEGYRAFQKRFSPRVVARSFYLGGQRRPLFVALAPLFAMALIHATPRRLIANWIILAGIVAIIVYVRTLPPVWRAMVDAGVLCALVWGTAALLFYFIQALRGKPPSIALDLPGETGSKSVF